MYTEYFGQKNINLWLKAQVKENNTQKSGISYRGP